jgi:hypothetical protein
MQLEKTFSSREGVKSVAAFLRSVLKEDMKAHKFILCMSAVSQIHMVDTLSALDQTPPRREFRVSDPAIRGRSLYDLQLAPSSILYVKFLDDPINGLLQLPKVLDCHSCDDPQVCQRMLFSLLLCLLKFKTFLPRLRSRHRRIHHHQGTLCGHHPLWEAAQALQRCRNG